MAHVFKIVILGEGGVGKTTLLNRYLNGIFTPQQKMTIGVQFNVKNLTIGNKEIVIQFWDCGGEERFRFLLQSYLKGSSALIFVFDITRIITFKHLSDWFKFVKLSLGENILNEIPWVVVGNKADIFYQTDIMKEEVLEFLRQYKEEVVYLEVSAKTGQNINEIFSYLLDEMIRRHEEQEKQEKVERQPIIIEESQEIEEKPIFHSLESKKQVGSTIENKERQSVKKSEVIVKSKVDKGKNISRTPEIERKISRVKEKKPRLFRRIEEKLYIPNLEGLKALIETPSELSSLRLDLADLLNMEYNSDGDFNIKFERIIEKISQELQSYIFHHIRIKDEKTYGIFEELISFCGNNRDHYKFLYRIEGLSYFLIGMQHLIDGRYYKAGLAFFNALLSFLSFLSFIKEEKINESIIRFVSYGFFLSVVYLGIVDYDYLVSQIEQNKEVLGKISLVYEYIMDKFSNILEKLEDKNKEATREKQSSYKLEKDKSSKKDSKMNSFFKFTMLLLRNGFDILNALEPNQYELGLLDNFESYCSVLANGDEFDKFIHGEIKKISSKIIDRYERVKLGEIKVIPSELSLNEPIVLNVQVYNLSKKDKIVCLKFRGHAVEKTTDLIWIKVSARSIITKELLAGCSIRAGKMIFFVELVNEEEVQVEQKKVMLYVPRQDEYLRISEVVIRSEAKTLEEFTLKIKLENQGVAKEACKLFIEGNSFERNKIEGKIILKPKEEQIKQFSMGKIILSGLRSIIIRLESLDDGRLCDEKIYDINIKRSWKDVFLKGLKKGVNIAFELIK
ncbi:MAG: Rab family GTPase [Promethearchaeota archaeon]